jgi:hypothetical protein
MTALDVESLARRFEPILYFHRGEKFFPSDAKRYVEHAALWRSLFPIDQKGSWGAGPLIAHRSIAALHTEAGTFLGTQIRCELSDLRFLELAGWKNKAEALEPTVTPTSDNSYSHRGVDPGDGGIATLYNGKDAAGGNTILRESRFWYHAEGFDTERLRRLLGSVRAPELVKVLDNAGLQNPALLCFYFFYPAHEESLADACTNVEAREFACFGGEWGCLAILLERESESMPFRPTFIGYSGRPVASAGVAQGGTGREVMKVSRFSAADRTDEHPKLFVARGTHSLYLEPGNQGVHDIDSCGGVSISRAGAYRRRLVGNAGVPRFRFRARQLRPTSTGRRAFSRKPRTDPAPGRADHQRAWRPPGKVDVGPGHIGQRTQIRFHRGQGESGLVAR